MKDVTFTYDTKVKGISGSFTRSMPELADLHLNPDLAEHHSLYWGWFRQVQVTLRGEAKRLREGNKSTSPLSEGEVASRMRTGKMPQYAAPTESLTEDQKIEKMAAAMTPAQIARFLAAAGITVHNS